MHHHLLTTSTRAPGRASAPGRTPATRSWAVPSPGVDIAVVTVVLAEHRPDDAHDDPPSRPMTRVRDGERREP